MQQGPGYLSASLPQLTNRILARLERAEWTESRIEFRDDYRIAWITVLYAARGDASECSPHVAATYAVLAMHPDKVWPAVVARRRAELGGDYSRWYDERCLLIPEMLDGVNLPPKKPAQSVHLWLPLAA